MNYQEVSKNLIRLRQLKHWTQDDLAQKLSISRQAISKWETGATLPNIDVLLSLSNIYGLTINEIIEPERNELITDFEELHKVDIDVLRKVLVDMNMRTIVVASMGASPDTNEILEKVFSEIDLKKERENIGRIQIKEVEKAEEEIVFRVNQFKTQT